MNRKLSDRKVSSISFTVLSYFFVVFISVFCLIPFVMLISASFSSETAIAIEGYGILPKEFTLEAYKMVFKYPATLIRAFGVSIWITAIGTIFGLLITSMTGFVLSRKDFKYRNLFSFFFFFTTLFNGGLVCTYIFIIRYLHLKNSFLALILPIMINVFYLLIMRSFISAIPVSLIESAKIDGASDFKIFFSIVIPLSKAALATIGLFIALGYWNDWYNAMLYISDRDKWPVQYMLYDMLNTAVAQKQLASISKIALQDLPSQSLKMAMSVVVILPTLFIYPFVQKYFVSGITIGAVKG
ncbi:MAG: carbohydrate ABC transporter permease [Lachnospirales bacterium]